MKVKMIDYLVGVRHPSIRKGEDIGLNSAVHTLTHGEYKFFRPEHIHHIYKCLADAVFMESAKTSHPVFSELIEKIRANYQDPQGDITCTLAGQLTKVWDLIDKFDELDLEPSPFLLEAIQLVFNATPAEMIASDRGDKFELFCARLELEELRFEKGNHREAPKDTYSASGVVDTLQRVRDYLENHRDRNDAGMVNDIKIAIRVFNNIADEQHRDNRSSRRPRWERDLDDDRDLSDREFQRRRDRDVDDNELPGDDDREHDRNRRLADFDPN